MNSNLSCFFFFFPSLHLPTTDTSHHTTGGYFETRWLHACWLPSGQAEWCQTIRVSSLLVLPWMNPKLYLIYPLPLILAWTRSQRELLCCRHSLSFSCLLQWMRGNSPRSYGRGYKRAAIMEVFSWPTRSLVGCQLLIEWWSWAEW